MKNRAFHFEIKDLLTQFIAAFDDTVISRFDRSRNPKQNVEVRYVFAPKQRVMYDIVNRAQNLTLPVVAVNLASVTRDESRVFNKLTPTFVPASLTDAPERVEDASDRTITVEAIEAKPAKENALRED